MTWRLGPQGGPSGGRGVWLVRRTEARGTVRAWVNPIRGDIARRDGFVFTLGRFLLCVIWRRPESSRSSATGRRP